MRSSRRLGQVLFEPVPMHSHSQFLGLGFVLLLQASILPA